MRRFNLRLSTVLFAATFAPLAFAAHTHLPVPSTWTLNLAESNFGGGPSMKSDTFINTIDNDKWGKWSDHMVDGDGKTWNSSWSGPENGQPRPFTGMPGTYSTDAATDVSVMTYPDGSVQTCNFSLSHDQKKYSEKCVAKASDGKQANQTLVYDRTK